MCVLRTINQFVSNVIGVYLPLQDDKPLPHNHQYSSASSHTSVCRPIYSSVNTSHLNWLTLSIYLKLHVKYNYACLSPHRLMPQWNKEMQTHTHTRTALTVTSLIRHIKPQSMNLMRSVPLSPLAFCDLTQTRSWSVSSLAQVWLLSGTAGKIRLT